MALGSSPDTVLPPNTLLPPTSKLVTRTELWVPVALPEIRTVPVKPALEASELRKRVPPPDFSMDPVPVSVPVPPKEKLLTPAALMPPKFRNVVAEVPPTLTVPVRERVPLTLLMRLLRMVAVGERASGLMAERSVPERVLLPRLKMADPRSPMGPRPSKSTSRAKMKPAAVPSNTSEPPPKPIKAVLSGVLLFVRIETVPVPPSAAPLLMISEPSEMVVAPV